MADKIGIDGIEKSMPKEKLDTSQIQEKSSSKPIKLTDLPNDINTTPKTKQSNKNTDSNKNPSKSNFLEGFKSTDYQNVNVGDKKKGIEGLSDKVDNSKLPQFAKNRLNDRIKGLDRRVKGGKRKIKDTAQNIKTKVEKAKKIAKAIGQFLAKFWLPILITIAIVVVVIPLIIALIMQVGNSPHFYCNLDAPPSVRSTAVYKQYCGGNVGGNDDIAHAAVSLAYHIPDINAVQTTYVGGKCSSGVSHSITGKAGSYPADIATQLYVDVHEEVIPNDPWYASCDRGTCTAVRWAGADDDFPAGPCSKIIEHCDNSDKWEKVGVLNETISTDELEPGDIMVYVNGNNGHVGIYVGEEAVKEVYPNSNCTTYAASKGDYCPQLQTMSGWEAGGAGGTNYTIYRNTQPEEASKYKDLQF